MEKIPSRITVTTGEQEKVQPIIDRFFQETRRGLETILPIKGPEAFSIRSGNIAYNGQQITDDRITTLSYKSHVIATVTETRTQGNHIVYNFFRDIRDIKE